MNFGNTPIFQLVKSKMAYLGQRQTVLASNVANVDTPGYQAKDVKEPNFAAMVAGKNLPTGKMVKTNPMHMSAMNQRGAFAVIDRGSLDEYNPNQNGINLDTEMQKVAFTQAEYNKVISIYRKNLSMIRTAVGNPSGG